MCIFCMPDEQTVGLTDAEILEAERCPNLASRVPATIITGFLGAGKTTLLNWLLRGSQGKRFCVLQNEFGSVPIDDALVVRNQRFADVAVVTMSSGCICCKVRGDLVEGLRALAKGVLAESGHFDAVLVETSGLSEVGPVAQTFFADRFVQRNFRLDAVLAVVDASTARPALELAKAGGAGVAPAGRIRSADDDDDDDDDDVSTISGDDGECEAADGGDGNGAGAGAGAGSGSGSGNGRSNDDAADAETRAQAARLLCEQLCLADVVLLNKLDLLEQGAGSRVQGARSRLQGAETREQGASDDDPGSEARVDGEGEGGEGGGGGEDGGGGGEGGVDVGVGGSRKAWEEVSDLIAEVNRGARLIPCRHSQVDLGALLHVNAFSVTRAVSRSSLFLKEARALANASANANASGGGGGGGGGGGRLRKAGSTAFANLTPPPDPGDPSGRAHLHSSFGSVGVESQVHTACMHTCTRAHMHTRTHARTHARMHACMLTHAPQVDLDELAFNDWLEELFTFHGSRFYRVKGIVFFRGIEPPSAVQCVGSHIECERMEVESVEPALVHRRASRLVSQ